MTSDIGEFLQARRTRVSPAAYGLPVSARRRVQGLRREELAMLAGVSADYYTRVEQGRAEAVSDAVLTAIAQVLGLDDTERAHLLMLARPPREDSAMPQQHVRAGVRRLLDSLPEVPAFVAGRWQEILATNALGAALLPDGLHEGSNSARFVFLNQASPGYYAEWEDVAAETAATLRWESGIHPGDPVLARLIGELSIASGSFASLWAKQEVQVKTHGTKRITHPTVGELTLEYETLMLPDDSDQILVTYVAADASSAAALAVLSDLARS